jgi:hypothetical protein
MLNVCAALLGVLVFAAPVASYADPQYLNQAPRVNADEQADSPLKGQQSPTDQEGHGAPTLKASGVQMPDPVPQPPASDAQDAGKAETERRAAEATEYWSILGRHVKITDTLLAVFTLALVIIGWWQGTKLHDTVTLGREEFISTHRPQIGVHAIEARETDSMASARVFFINKGGTAATIEEIKAVVVKTSKPMTQFESSLVLTGITARNGALASGMKDWFDIEFPPLQTVGVVTVVPEGKDYFCIGVIFYRDGVGNLRETGFIRVFKRDSQANNLGPRRWVRLEGESEYQYEY